jgi:hypothetical protein
MTDKAPRIEEIRALVKAGRDLAPDEGAFLLGEVERLTEATELRKQVKDDAIAQMNVWAKAAEKAEQARDRLERACRIVLEHADANRALTRAKAIGPNGAIITQIALINVRDALSPSDRIEPTPEEGKD